PHAHRPDLPPFPTRRSADLQQPAPEQPAAQSSAQSSAPPAPEPAPEPAPQQAQQPEPQPAPEPAPQQAPQPAPEPAQHTQKSDAGDGCVIYSMSIVRRLAL